MKRTMIIMVALIALAITTLSAKTSFAQAWATDNCAVTSSFWTWDTPDGALDLPRAVYHSSMQGDPNLWGCRKSISIAVTQQMLMLTPLLIQVNGDSEANPFVIDGSASSNGQAVIDATNLVIPDGSDLKCAIQIEGQYVKLANIRINNIANGHNGVCINSPNVTIENVDIAGGSKGGNDGIVFMGGSNFYGNKVMASASVEGMAGYAINFGEVSTSSLSTNYVYPIDPIDAISDTDDYGISYVKDGTTKLTIKTGDVAKMFNNNSDERVCVQKKMTFTDPKDKTKTGLIEFKGSVRVSSSDAAADLVKASVAVDVKRMQIWGADGLLGYVGKWRSDKQVGMADNTATGSGNYTGLTGQFTFRLDPSKLGSNSRIILIPDLGDGRIGKVSSIMNVTAGCGQSGEECPCGSVTNQYCILHPDDAQCKTGNGNQGDPNDPNNVGGGWGTNHNGFKSIADCRQQRGIMAPGQSGSAMSDPTWDTDGDGIPDDQEDVNLNCECDSMETCWYKGDTDDDGITDNLEKRPALGTDVDAAGFKPDASVDIDGDGLYNAIDKDSDNDAKMDGEEDRNQYVYTVSMSGTNSTMGLLYPFGNSIFYAYPLQKKDGTGPIKCDLGSASNIGVRYDWYQVFADKDPARFNGYPSSTDSTYSIQVFACRNQSLNSPKNFNGVYDNENNEMNFENPDTDGDGWCDGSGSSCTGDAATHGKDDACPLIANSPANENKCGGDKPCFDTMMFYTTDARYVDWDNEGNPVKLRDSGPAKDSNGKIVNNDGSIANDGIPDVFQVKGGYEQIALLCGDTDQDGIPDCVENPSGKCGDKKCGTPLNSSDNPSGLKHYCADTDGDGLIDGYKGGALSDVCPATAGANGMDKFEEGKKAYSCGDGTKVYNMTEVTKYIAYFLDRDNDGLRDGEEDRDLDGLYDNIVKRMVGVGKTESNPLSRDSDKDGVSDILEVRGWPMATNPSDDDSDGDGLKDGDEDRDWDGASDHLITVTMRKGMEGCPNAMKHDTDPTKPDTDGDGLTDYQEVSGGALVVGNDFVKLLSDPDIFKSGIPGVSDPTSADSDDDGLTDSQEYSGGVIKVYDTNPCMKDSDYDGINDPDEFLGCALSADSHCKGTEKVKDAAGEPKDSSNGIDHDHDGLSDLCEAQLGTDPNNWDSDGDGISDGEETNGNCNYDPSLGMTNPMAKDTDNDGLADNLERKYGTDPTKADSDGDCIPDGVEDANQDGSYDPGTETDANNPDTDGDGLPDGWIPSVGMGEDLNCNGIRDKDANGNFTETDPRNRDSNMNGESDYDEMLRGGNFNINNIEHAVTRHEGCSMIPGAAADASTSMFYLFGMLMTVSTVVARRIRKTPA